MVIAAGSYVAHIILSYYRIGNVALDIDNVATLVTLDSSQEYSAVSYNIGFGAYSQDYTFFMDSGYDDDGNQTCRNNDIEWEPGNTFICTVDGFITSDNITVSSVSNILTKNGNKGYDGFAYSDHEPVQIKFTLN